MKYLKLFENFNDDLGAKFIEAVPNANPDDIAAAKDGLYFGFDKGLKLAAVVHGSVTNKYNSSNDPEWPVWTAITSDGTKLGFMFEDGYWEKEN